MKTTIGEILLVGMFSAIGGFMAFAMVNPTVNNWIGGIWWLKGIFEWLHLPAFLVLRLWSWLKLPPHGDSAFALIPWAMFGQWPLLGLFIVAAWRRMQARLLLRRLRE